jgi:hypothetical protein
MSEETPAVDERSGADVVEAIDVAAAGTEHGGVERPPSEARSKESPVEQTEGDPAMTEADQESEPTLPPGAPVSGGAQSSPGSRASDRIAGGER